MKYTYEIINNDNARPVIKRVDEDGNEAWIPTDPSNSDYQAYLNPVEHLTDVVE
jgi:hypothetical protein